MKCPKADDIACPWTDGYNDHHTYLRKGKDDSTMCATAATVTPESSPIKPMVILSNYELQENKELGVFR